MFESPIFDQLANEFFRNTGHTYESLTQDGPVMLRVPQIPLETIQAVQNPRPIPVYPMPEPISVKPLSQVPFHERWLDETTITPEPKADMKKRQNLKGLRPKYVIDDEMDRKELERLELGDRVVDAMDAENEGPSQYFEGHGVNDRTAVYFKALAPKMKPEDELMGDLRDKVRTLIERDPSKGSREDGRSLQARHQNAVELANRVNEEFDGGLLNEFLKESMLQRRKLEEDHPGYIETDTQFEKDEDGGIKVVIEGIAPANPEDAVAFRELYNRSKTDPAPRDLFIPKQPAGYMVPESPTGSYLAPTMTYDEAVTKAKVDHPRKPIKNVELPQPTFLGCVEDLKTESKEEEN